VQEHEPRLSKASKLDGVFAVAITNNLFLATMTTTNIITKRTAFVADVKG
jgi:hypothetical protein